MCCYPSIERFLKFSHDRYREKLRKKMYTHTGIENEINCLRSTVPRTRWKNCPRHLLTLSKRQPIALWNVWCLKRKTVEPMLPVQPAKKRYTGGAKVTAAIKNESKIVCMCTHYLISMIFWRKASISSPGSMPRSSLRKVWKASNL